MSEVINGSRSFVLKTIWVTRCVKVRLIIYAARIRGLADILQTFTHSLRCGLEEYRQLRWLRFTSEPLIAEKQRQRGSAVTKTTNYMER